MSGLLDDHEPDALGDVDQQLGEARHATVQLALGRDKAEVVDLEQRGARPPVGPLELPLALDRRVRRSGRGVRVAP